tara:strand:+ start:851 stop:1033 length:183 start_codon:yes stop_codon:yes gene_type:complete
MDKKNRSKWTIKFRSLGKKKGSRQDFINLYKEMKKEKDDQENDRTSIFKKVIDRFTKGND